MDNILKEKASKEINELNLATLVTNALLYYDEKSIEYNKYINVENIKINRMEGTIIFNDIDLYKYEILGLFDNTNHIWMWAWMVPDFISSETNIVKKLLFYGLKINPSILTKVPDDKLYLKTQLVNSRFLLQDEFQLELHLAISSYLAKDNFKFIYSKKKYLSNDKKKYITVYYMII